jgi:hypothetical protein
MCTLLIHLHVRGCGRAPCSLVSLFPTLNMTFFSSMTGGVTGNVSPTLGRQLYELFALDVFNGFQPWLNVSNSCNFPCAFVPQSPACKVLLSRGLCAFGCSFWCCYHSHQMVSRLLGVRDTVV